MLTYRYKLYSSNRNRKIDAMLCEACFVWNHALALQKRYYRLTGRYCSYLRMKHHFSRRIASCRLHGDFGAVGCRLPRFIIQETAVITHTTSYTLHQESLQPHGRTSGGSLSSGPGGLPVGLLRTGHIGRHGRGVRKVHNKDQSKTPRGGR